MQITADDIKAQIPYYLTQAQKDGFVKALNEFPCCNYYISAHENEILQGDGWTSFEVVRFNDDARRPIKGIVLSNSCDIDPSNQRDRLPLITFAPLIPMTAFEGMLDYAKLNAQQKEDKLNAVRKQHITSIFYLPKGGKLDEEYVALLDDLHTIPLPHYLEIKDRMKLFTLSQVGFYLFIMKLSIHFCRMHEAVER